MTRTRQSSGDILFGSVKHDSGSVFKKDKETWYGKVESNLPAARKALEAWKPGFAQVLQKRLFACIICPKPPKK